MRAPLRLAITATTIAVTAFPVLTGSPAVSVASPQLAADQSRLKTSAVTPAP